MMNRILDIDQHHLMTNKTFDDGRTEIAANPYNTVDVIADIDEFFTLRESWDAINSDASNGTIFNSWEWMYTWWETYKDQGKRNLYLLRCTNIHNELLGIAPFQIVNNPKKYFPCNRQLIMLGTGETDGCLVFGEYTDLVIKKGHETAVISAFSDYLAKHSILWDGIKFQQQLADSHVSKLFQCTDDYVNANIGRSTLQKSVIEDGFRTCIDLPETYKDYLMSLRKKMRNNITRTFSRLENEQNFTLTEVSTESEIQAQIAGKQTGIETLANLNRARREALNTHSVFDSVHFELFHKRLLKRLLPLHKVSLRILAFNDEPVAALYSFVDGDTLHVYQSGFEVENGHRYSLMTTLLTQEISNSIDNKNIKRFNFMYASDESTYKKRYSGETEKMYNISYDKIGIKLTIYRFIHVTLKAKIKRLLGKQ